MKNPVLPGFNPDPSIVRVGEDYYVATSTFEWYPGVQIHHSRDLRNFRLLTRPLSRESQLDMRGDPDSGGIWAPCLSHRDGLFYLVFTDVKRYGGSPLSGSAGMALRDTHNYLVTSPRIDGPWSDPAFLNSSGFDPSLFHASDGRKYLVNMLWNHRPGGRRFDGIVLQEYDHERKRLVGERRVIFEGSSLGFTEAPHLFERGGYYYLITAEGGTGFGHAVTLARSRDLMGPYELHPDVHVLSARSRPDAALQRAGHADLVETPNGETFMVYLCGRPIPNRGRCTLGRETAIQQMRWADDGWLYTLGERGMPQVELGEPVLPEHPFEPAAARSEFDEAELPIDFQWLRTPHPDELFSLSERPGHLRLFGRESIGSHFRQSLVARRLDSHCASIGTSVEFEPRHFQQMAGLVCYYNSFKYHYLFVSHDEKLGKCLRVMSRHPDCAIADCLDEPTLVPAGQPLELFAEIDLERLRFGYRAGEGGVRWLPRVYDASILSDEATQPGLPNFTGAFVGMACQDLSGEGLPADFDFFEYRARGFLSDSIW